jgi:AcrR family transcriptional regulator
MSGRRLAGEARSQAIVRSALGLFARQGFDGTTTRRLAQAAGVSEALLFKHFPNKEALYRAILEFKIQDAESALPLDGTLDRLSDEEFFLKIATTIMRRVDADDAFCRLMIRSALDGHDLARQFHQARGGRMLTLMAKRLKDRYRRMGIRDGVDPALAARMFNGMILASMMQRRIFNDEVIMRTPIEPLARALVRVFLGGIGSGEARA